MRLQLSLLFTLTCLVACGSGGQQSTQSSIAPTNVTSTSNNLDDYPGEQEVPQNQDAEHLSILFFGNSHTSQLPPLVMAMIRAGAPQQTVEVKQAPGIYFLDERLDDDKSPQLLRQQTWTHLILQGQKYSQSFSREYPTHATRTWIRMAKSLNVTPVLYPEHARRNLPRETSYVYDLYKEIAQQEPSCLAPVGLAWERVIQVYPELNLHQADGNHATQAGRVLTAYVLYEMITGQAADLLPYIASLNIDQATQENLSQLATESIHQQQNCIDLFNGS